MDKITTDSELLAYGRSGMLKQEAKEQKYQKNVVLVPSHFLICLIIWLTGITMAVATFSLEHVYKPG